MCSEAVEEEPWQLHHVPDQYKTQEMCDKVVWEGPFFLQYVPDWFVTQQQVNLWHDDSKYHDDDKFIGYKIRKPKKQK